MYYICVLVVIKITTSSALFIDDLENENSKLTNTILFDIRCKCFADEEYNTLIGIWNNEILQQMQDLCHPVSVSIVGINNLDLEQLDNRPRLSVHKLDNYKEALKPQPSNIFFINEVELLQLNRVLLKLKSSIWWNQYGIFFIKLTKYRNNCIYASSYLKVFWNFEILKIIFLCENPDHTMQYYTFNPFSSSMPVEWVHIEQFPQKNHHPFRIFKLQNNSFSVICNTLKFDKSSSLDGYPIKLAAHPDAILIFDDKLSQFHGPELSNHQVFWSILKASLSVSHTKTANMGILYPNGTADGTLADVLRGKYDSIVNIKFDKKLWKNQVYIYEQTALCFAVKKKLSMVNQQVLKWITWKLIIFIILLHVILTITFMTLFKVTFFEALFDVLRAILGASTLRRPLSPRYRITFLLVLLGIMLITLFLNGTLCTLVATPSFEPFPETRNDLINNNYTLYAPAFVKDALSVMNLLNRTHFDHVSLDTCIQAVEDRADLACVDFCSKMSYVVTESKKIHISKFKKYHKTYYTLLHRDNLSFRKRWLYIVQACQESGLTIFHINLSRFIYRKRNNDSIEIASITQQQMTIIYLFWLYGLIFSCFTLILEYLIQFMKRRFLPKISNVPRKPIY